MGIVFGWTVGYMGHSVVPWRDNCGECMGGALGYMRWEQIGMHRGGVPCAVQALCEKLAVLHHREFGKFRRLKGRH